LSEIVHYLPHVNAGLNALATVLLVAGYVQIKLRREAAHKWTMLACFGVSIVFLASYLTYHFNIPGGSKRFPTDEAVAPAAMRYVYYAILLTHVVLAAAVPFLAVATIWLGLANKRRAHVRLAKWTFPIWLYVSVTGVIVYAMLYQIYAPPESAHRIEASPTSVDAR
jgi:putative membrane protein